MLRAWFPAWDKLLLVSAALRPLCLHSGQKQPSIYFHKANNCLGLWTNSIY